MTFIENKNVLLLPLLSSSLVHSLLLSRLTATLNGIVKQKQCKTRRTKNVSVIRIQMSILNTTNCVITIHKRDVCGLIDSTASAYSMVLSDRTSWLHLHVFDTVMREWMSVHTSATAATSASAIRDKGIWNWNEFWTSSIGWAHR